MNYRRYDNQDRPAEIDPKVESPRAFRLFKVTCRRRTTAGQMVINVKADTAEEADTKVRKGTAQPGMGLGWIPVRVTDITPGG